MDIEWLNSFLVTSRLKSLSKASQVLTISQPALSKQIKNLENYYGVELFKRSTQGVELTEEGELFVKRIHPLLLDMESLRTDILNVKRLTSVRIGVFPSIAAIYLPKEILKLKKMGVQVDMVVLNTSMDILNALQIDQIDVGILQRPQNVPKTYWYHDLFSESFYAIVPEGHPLFSRTELSIEELTEEPLIVYPQQCDIRQSIYQAYSALQIKPRFDLEVEFGESIIGFVKAGAGITILPEINTSQINTNNLAVIPITDFAVKRTLGLIAGKQTVGKKLYRLLKTAESHDITPGYSQ